MKYFTTPFMVVVKGCFGSLLLLMRIKSCCVNLNIIYRLTTPFRVYAVKKLIPCTFQYFINNHFTTRLFVCKIQCLLNVSLWVLKNQNVKSHNVIKFINWINCISKIIQSLIYEYLLTHLSIIKSFFVTNCTFRVT